MADDNKTTPLKPAVKNPNNVEAKKYYTFNETGNIMMASTDDQGKPLDPSVQAVFSEVAVFFAGMTRAITTTINPATNKPYSLYNYHAMENVIGGSGLFVHVTEEDVKYSTRDVGVDFSKNLIESLLGLATGAGEMAFASAMISSIGKEGLRISESHSSSESKVGNIVFVCEYLLGMPVVSAIVVYADCKKNAEHIQTGPCFSTNIVTTEWTLHKDTYLFVTPTFIRKNAADLDSIESDPNYVEMIHWLQGLLMRTPVITSVYDVTAKKTLASGESLITSQQYTLQGEFLPSTKGSLKMGTASLPVSNWSPTEISFTAPTTAVSTAQVIDVYTAGDVKIVSSPGAYKVKTPS